MRKICGTAMLIALTLLVRLGRADPEFQNLGFESSLVIPPPANQFAPSSTMSQAFPAWSGFLDAESVPWITVNNVTLGRANISILAAELDAPGDGVMDGK